MTKNVGHMVTIKLTEEQERLLINVLVALEEHEDETKTVIGVRVSELLNCILNQHNNRKMQ